MQLSEPKLSRAASYLIGLMIVLVPFHAFLTVWGASLLGHYTVLRLWDEVALIVLGFLCLPLMVTKLRSRGSQDILWYLLASYVLVEIIWGLVAHATQSVTLKALGYGWIVNLRFVLFFGLAWLVASQDDWLRRNIWRLLLVPALIVSVFGILQYTVLPHDFMKHFGYGPSTIAVSETIDHKVQYPRIASTLRGSNPLGAYLVIVVSVALAALLAAWRKAPEARRWLAGAALVLGGLTLLFSFSRSAWIAATVALVWLIWLAVSSPRGRRVLMVAAVGLLAVFIASILALRHNDFVENTIFHTDEHSTSAVSSNAGHASAFREGVHDLLHQPLGQGPGTAGPASVYNANVPRFAENYFLQVGQEAGWIGLLLFVGITLRLLQLLWRRRSDSLALALYAAGIGLIIVNFLSHAWTDDTLAFIWWGGAAIALSLPIPKAQKAATDVR